MGKFDVPEWKLNPQPRKEEPVTKRFCHIEVHMLGGLVIILPHDVQTVHQLVCIMGDEEKSFFQDYLLNKFNIYGKHIAAVIEITEDEEDDDQPSDEPRFAGSRSN